MEITTAYYLLGRAIGLLAAIEATVYLDVKLRREVLEVLAAVNGPRLEMVLPESQVPPETVEEP